MNPRIELSWRQVGGLNLQTPVASLLAAVAPDDAVEGFKKKQQLTAFPDVTCCAAVGGWSLSVFQHQRQPMKREQAQLVKITSKTGSYLPVY
jgi:hypothetical protein